MFYAVNGTLTPPEYVDSQYYYANPDLPQFYLFNGGRRYSNRNYIAELYDQDNQGPQRRPRPGEEDQPNQREGMIVPVKEKQVKEKQVKLSKMRKQVSWAEPLESTQLIDPNAPNDNQKFTVFDAKVITSSEEQESEYFEKNKEKLKELPKIGELQIPSGDGEEPPYNQPNQLRLIKARPYGLSNRNIADLIDEVTTNRGPQRRPRPGEEDQTDQPNQTDQMDQMDQEDDWILVKKNPDF